MSKSIDEMRTESGLISDVVGTITSAYFGPPTGKYAELGGVDPGLHIVLEGEDIEKPYDQFYACGAAKKWQVAENGQALVSEVNPNSHGFNKSSRAGTLVNEMALKIGEGNLEKGLQFLADRDYWMTQAPFYVGLTFFWKTKPLSTVAKEGEEKGSRDVLLPDKFIGASKPASAPVNAAPPPPVQADTSDLDICLIDLSHGKTFQEIRQLALKRDDFKANSAYMKTVINGTALARLEKDGLVSKDASGKYQ